MTEKDLLQLKKDIENAKSDISRQEGVKDSLMKQLKKDFNCSTLEEAEEKLSQLNSKAETLNKKVKAGLQELEEKFMS